MGSTLKEDIAEGQELFGEAYMGREPRHLDKQYHMCSKCFKTTWTEGIFRNPPIVCPFCKEQHARWINITDRVSGPWYWVVLQKRGAVLQQSKPKARHVIENQMEVDLWGQVYLHFLQDSETGKTIDFESHNGFDRGPRFRAIVRYLVGKQLKLADEE